MTMAFGIRRLLIPPSGRSSPLPPPAFAGRLKASGRRGRGPGRGGTCTRQDQRQISDEEFQQGLSHCPNAPLPLPLPPRRPALFVFAATAGKGREGTMLGCLAIKS